MVPTLAGQEAVNQVPLRLDLLNIHDRPDGPVFQTKILAYQRQICHLGKRQIILKINSNCLKKYAEAARRLSFPITRTHHKRDCASAWPPPSASPDRQSDSQQEECWWHPLQQWKNNHSSTNKDAFLPWEWLNSRKKIWVHTTRACAYVYTCRATGCDTVFI